MWLSENKEKYPSGEVLYDISKSEYENEKKRTSILDSKINIVVSLTSVFFVAITQVLNLKKIFSINITSFSDVILPAILFLTIISSMVVSFISLFFFLKAIFTKEYKEIDPKYFYDINKLKKEKELYTITVAHFYIEATMVNKKENDNRVIIYQKGLKLLIVSIFLFSLYMLLKDFLL